MTKRQRFSMYSSIEIPLCQNPQKVAGLEDLVRSGHPQVRLLVTNEILDKRPLPTREAAPGTKPPLYTYPNMYLVFYVGMKSLKLSEYFDEQLNRLDEVAAAARAYDEACAALEAANAENEQYLRTIPAYELVMLSIQEVQGVAQAAVGEKRYQNKRRKQGAEQRGQQALRRLHEKRDLIIGNSSPPHSSATIEALDEAVANAQRIYDDVQGRYNTAKNRRMWFTQYLADERHGVGLLRAPEQVTEAVIRTPHWEGSRETRRWINPMPFYELEHKPHRLETNRLGIPMLGPEDDPCAYERLVFPYDIFIGAMRPERRNQFNIVDRRWGAFVPIAPDQPASSDMLDPVPAILLTSLEVHEWALVISDALRQEILLNMDDLMPSVIEWHVDRNPLHPQLPATRPTPLLTDGSQNVQDGAHASPEGEPVEGATEQGVPQGTLTH